MFGIGFEEPKGFVDGDDLLADLFSPAFNQDLDDNAGRRLKEDVDDLDVEDEDHGCDCGGWY